MKLQIHFLQFERLPLTIPSVSIYIYIDNSIESYHIDSIFHRYKTTRATCVSPTRAHIRAELQVGSSHTGQLLSTQPAQ